MTWELVEFLTAQYDRIEKAARKAAAGPWRVDSESYAEAIYSADQTSVVAGGRYGDEAPVFESTEDALHIALHDPAYVLADIKSKRRIVELHGDQHECTDTSASEYPYVGCETLRLLAAPFSGEPGYKAEEWAI